MTGESFDRQKSGYPIAARTLNRPIASVERQSKLRVGNGMAQETVAGSTMVRSTARHPFWVRITAVGTGGKYGWQAITGSPTTPGAWIDADTRLSGTTTVDPLFEANANTTLTVGTRVKVQREFVSNQAMVQYDHC